MTFAHNLITAVARTTTATRSRCGGGRCSSCSPTSRPCRAPTPSTRCTRSSPGRSGRCSRSAGSCTRWSIPLQYLGRPYILYRRRYAATRSVAMSEAHGNGAPARARDARVHGLLLRLGAARPARPRPAGGARALGLPDLGDGRRPGAARSLMRIPLGLARRPPRRPARVHRADGLHAAAARSRSRSSTTPSRRSSRSASCSASPARRSPSACRSSTAGTRPSARASRSGIYGIGMGGTVLAGLTAPRIADQWGLAAPFWVAAGAGRGGAASSGRARPRRARRRGRSAPGDVRVPLVGVPAPAGARGRSRSSTSWRSAASSRCSSTCRSC